MSYQKQNFGMMDEGYFVPRGELIDWINNLLDLNLTKIQQLGAGSVYCQIVDVIHPGKVPMSKVNWKAKNQYQFINNLKILQTAFDKAGVKRYVEVQKLAKTKYQDNLQFIQWLKRYYDLNCGDRGSSYNAKQRRGNVAVDLSFAQKTVVPKTFNSGGQMQNKSQAPVKKTTTTNPVIPNKSTVVQNKIQTKPTIAKVQRKVEQKPTVKIQKQSPVKQGTGGTKIMKKDVSQKKIGNQRPSINQSNNDHWKMKYWDEVQKNKDLQLKLKMIQQILKSTDDSQIKLAMLAQIVKGPQQQSNMQEQKHQNMQVQHQDYQVQHSQQNDDDVI